MYTTIAHVIGILAVALLLGTAANVLSPRGIAWVEDWANRVERGAVTAGLLVVELDQVRQLLAAGTHLVFDARPAADYQAGHLPGAMSLPVENLDAMFAQFAPVLEPDTALLVYCSGAECDESLQLGAYFQPHGYTNVAIFPGGYDAWQTATTGGAP